MPETISQSYYPPICKCGRFKAAHLGPNLTITDNIIGPCAGFEEAQLSDTELGQHMDAFLEYYTDKQK